jgi:hypothetical protein
MNATALLAAFAAGIASASAAAGGAQPDLVPVTATLTNGTVAVLNQGAAASPATLLTLSCQRLGGGGCPETPGMATYESPMFPNQATVQVPALETGASYAHPLAFWNELVWAPGDYVFTLTVDAAAAVGESMEGNNVAAVPYTVDPRPASTGPVRTGDLAATPSARPLHAAGKLVAGLPDLMATTLGFVIGGAPHPWGSLIAIDRPHLAAQTRSGPQANMCRFAATGYRVFNKGAFAAGPSTATVLRAGVPVASHNVALGPQAWEWKVFDLLLAEGANPVRVHLDDFDQVPEGDESNNEYQVTVLVKIDCDGDGRVAGLPPSALSASPARPLRAPLPEKAVPAPAELKSGRTRR